MLFVVSSLLFMGVASAIKCYVCTGCNGVDGDPTCEGEQCYKGKASAGGVDVISRSCVATSVASNECKKVELLGTESTQCYCNTELCNGAGSVVASITVIASVLLAAIVM